MFSPYSLNDLKQFQLLIGRGGSFVLRDGGVARFQPRNISTANYWISVTFTRNIQKDKSSESRRYLLLFIYCYHMVSEDVMDSHAIPVLTFLSQLPFA